MSALKPAALTALLLLVACSGAQQQSTEDRETAALAPLKQTYSGVVTGFDLKPHDTLIIFIDANGYLGMDDDAVNAMKKVLLAKWTGVWKDNHPGRHATIHLELHDFMNRKWAAESAKV